MQPVVNILAVLDAELFAIECSLAGSANNRYGKLFRRYSADWMMMDLEESIANSFGLELDDQIDWKVDIFSGKAPKLRSVGSRLRRELRENFGSNDHMHVVANSWQLLLMQDHTEEYADALDELEEFILEDISTWVLHAF